MSPSKQNNPDQEDLLWLAYRFINDELGPDEADEFAQRLGEDQSAREAVAAAVELDATLLAALKLPAGQPAGAALESVPQPAGKVATSRWSQRLAWTALGVAACLAVMLIGPGLLKEGQDGDAASLPSNEAPEDPSSELALLWAAWPSPSESEAVEAPAVEDAQIPSTTDWATWDSTELDLASEAAAESASDEIPSWLMTAVSLDAEMMDLHERMPENTPPAVQEN